MYSYELLEAGCYYLIQEQQDSPISLIKVTVESDHCVFVSRYNDEFATGWKRKTDPIHDIIELLSDDAVRAWESSYNNNQDAYNYEEDED
ncbi:MAG: hypothetical protein WCF67_07475 [Chitinophagaceae bacterium]